MSQETSPQPTSSPAPARPRQAITGVTAPQVAEARIREEWPTVLGINAGLASLARRLMQTFVLAPLGFLLLLPLFLLKFSPWVCRRYRLTNRRLMILRGWAPGKASLLEVISRCLMRLFGRKPQLVQRILQPVREVALADIDEVRLDPASVDPFYLSAPLEVVSKGQVVMTLPGVPEPEGFRHAVINAVKAWVPSKATGPFQPASAVSDGAAGKA